MLKPTATYHMQSRILYKVKYAFKHIYKYIIYNIKLMAEGRGDSPMASPMIHGNYRN